MSTVRCLKVLDGRPVAISGSRDATLRVWDIERGVQLRVLVGHQHSVRCIEISGNKLVSGSYDTTCRVGPSSLTRLEMSSESLGARSGTQIRANASISCRATSIRSMQSPSMARESQADLSTLLSASGLPKQGTGEASLL